MRKAALLCVLSLPFLAALSQAQPNTRSDIQWAKVQQLKPGATIHLKTAQASAKCSFRSADATSLVCAHGTDTTYRRSDIRSISMSHRGRSTAIGLVAGGGIGAIAGAASTGPNGIINRSGVAGIFGVAAALLGAAIGAATDFTHGTLYNSH